MDGLSNGSRTLVACVATAGIAAMACCKVITGEQALGMITLIWGVYTGIKTTMKDKNPPAA